MCFCLGWWTLLLPWPGERTTGLPRGSVHLQWAAVRTVLLFVCEIKRESLTRRRPTVMPDGGWYTWRDLNVNMLVFGWKEKTCLLGNKNSFGFLVTSRWFDSVIVSLIVYFTLAFHSFSGMFDDGKFVYLIEPLKPIHTVVSSQNCRFFFRFNLPHILCVNITWAFVLFRKQKHDPTLCDEHHRCVWPLPLLVGVSVSRSW